jgi:hypothetical protein
VYWAKNLLPSSAQPCFHNGLLPPPISAHPNETVSEKSSCILVYPVKRSTARRRHHRSPPPAAMRPLARLQRHLSLSTFRGHSTRHAWPPSADAAYLCRGLASSSSSAAAAAAAGREKSSRRTLGYLLGVAVAMVGASYAAVPLYRRFCQATGYGGTVQRREVWFPSPFIILEHDFVLIPLLVLVI